MNNPAQDPQFFFVSKTATGYEIHLTTDGVVGKHVLTLTQPGSLSGSKTTLKETEMEAVAIATANALAHIKRG